MGPRGLRLDEHESSVVSRTLTWSMVCTAVSARAWNLESRIACLLGQSRYCANYALHGFPAGKAKAAGPGWSDGHFLRAARPVLRSVCLFSDERGNVEIVSSRVSGGPPRIDSSYPVLLGSIGSERLACAWGPFTS